VLATGLNILVAHRAQKTPHLTPLDEAGRLAEAYPALLVQADRIAHTVAMGFHGRRRPGTGESFWQFQRYRPGDEAQRIDWRKSARSDQLYVRENEWEAANTIWMWTSGSPGMHFKSKLAQSTKAERATLLMLTLAALMLNGGERVGLLGSGRTPVYTRSGLERLALMHQALDGGRELPDAVPPRHSNVIIFSDFLLPIEAWRDRLAPIAERQVRGHLVQVFDPAEETLPYTGRKEFEETGGSLRFIIGRTETVREAYRERIAQHRDELRSLARRLGWSFTLHHTDQPAQQAILPLYGLLEGSLTPRTRV